MSLFKSSGVALLLSSLRCFSADDALQRRKCIAFGTGGIAESDCDSLHGRTDLPVTRHVPASWAIETDHGLALLGTETSKPSSVTLWEGEHFTKIGLGALATPVGGAYLDGKLYIACFGSWPTPKGDSGIAVVDVAAKRLESTTSFSEGGDGRMHVHNAYVFDFGGRKEVFGAILGNPWTGPLAGKGLAMLDRSSGKFVLQTTTGADLNVRSAKQQADGSIFVVTQEPAGHVTKLARLEERSGHLVVVAQTTLPPRPAGGDGGADVILGRSKDTLWVTDRQSSSAPGKLYYFTYSAGSFSLVRGTDTGNNPRYTVVLDNGDIVSCNQDGNDLTIHEGLALNPTESSDMKRISTVTGPMFFIETAKVGISDIKGTKSLSSGDEECMARWLSLGMENCHHYATTPKEEEICKARCRLQDLPCIFPGGHEKCMASWLMLCLKDWCHYAATPEEEEICKARCLDQDASCHLKSFPGDALVV